jgi:hypothetical protein
MGGGRVLISLEPARAFHLCNSKMQVSSCHLKTPILVIIVALQIPRQMDGNNNN